MSTVFHWGSQIMPVCQLLPGKGLCLECSHCSLGLVCHLGGILPYLKPTSHQGAIGVGLYTQKERAIQHRVLKLVDAYLAWTAPQSEMRRAFSKQNHK